ncbi:DNA alkylation repair protein [Chitinophaga sp. NPDC101104]|uniref:DNA alkylation repair protein n=1 Tax=Chitinophaga sp. NPDC101104 TaxID=3390561 RepID=UPI003D02650B
MQLTARAFTSAMKDLQSPDELRKIQRYFKSGEGQYGEGDTFMGVKMGEVFKLAKAYMKMPLEEVEKLLESPVHEIRAGAVSIMDFQARDKKTQPDQRKALFELYLRRHDRINNWDLVDRSAQFVVGAWLFDKPRKVLYTLARSKNPWERRTAIVSSAYFLRKGQTEDTFQIAEILRNDPEEIVQKAAGGWVREAGKQNPGQLYAFLDKYAATLPRTMLRQAIEKLSPAERKHYMTMA